MNERVEMMVDIYESAEFVRDHDIRRDTNTQQPLRRTESEYVKMRSSRSVTVCLVLLCVLLLTAVIVLCVLIYTNNHQFHIKNKQLTEEKDQLLTNNTKLITQNNQLNKEKNKLWKCFENDGWIYYKLSLYHISSARKSWNESRNYCRERGADLIIINNKEEQTFIKRAIPQNLVWIGLSDRDKKGTWKWVDGSTPTYIFWGSGESSGRKTANCVLLNSTSWVNFPCNQKYKGICEKICL